MLLVFLFVCPKVADVAAHANYTDLLFMPNRGRVQLLSRPLAALEDFYKLDIWINWI